MLFVPFALAELCQQPLVMDLTCSLRTCENQGLEIVPGNKDLHVGWNN